MALLDVTQILLDPDFTDSFTVLRRAQVIDTHGMASVSTNTFSNVLGVVTAISPSDLDRKEDYESTSRSISVVCKFRLRGETTNYQPDIVFWRGDNYVVKHVDPYPQFGAGFMQAECTSMDKTDVPFEPPSPGALDFTSANNSIFTAMVTL